MGVERPLFNRINEKPVSVHERVMREIKSAITQGLLKPGDKLPPERELAKMLGVSRTSLREALKILELSGVVTIKHGQGVFISDSNSTEHLQKLINHIFVDNQKIIELFEIRKVLETQAVVWACEKGKDEHFDEIINLLENTKKLLEENKSDYLRILAQQDDKFHQMIISAAGNNVLKLIMQTMLDLLAENREKTALIPDRPRKSLEEHMFIAKALKKRDSVAAKNAMLRHLENVERDILQDENI
ncbi:MAG: GntR family transcriptional regulator, transcriptional repressor for pyruvate dehydrogenase complex [Clostridia bacterium]|jgi:GntR family transcriptional repressor for pyruvate dehydrogenase complex|nr:GntR family transcriptional regulator [Clostridiales bacterium]MDK2985493.1 GntR family transcriptional regulator, transcriptional repressor for pyruvate dehydrogenase complex [Clostridia bacterium]